ncbi:MAG: amidase [Myxococcales bacterium]|nr:amidase [Myxococcales bacterium]
MRVAADLLWQSAAAQRAALARREVSALELLEATLARTEQVSTTVNPLAIVLDERARAAAERADEALRRGEGGPLCGIPATVKDSQWLAGVACRNGSRVLDDFVPEVSCAAVERLEAAGAVIFGKTTCPEFSLLGITESPAYGRTSNPWDLSRTPGGSSGGAAAAVASGLGPFALGGDGGGSIRIPAAFCGLVGFKPTFGLVPREPCFPTWKTLAVYGPLARKVEDARLLLGALAGAHPRDRHSITASGLDAHLPSLRGQRVVASESLGFAPVNPDVSECFRRVLQTLEDEGVEIVFDDPGLPSSVQTWAVTAHADTFVADREHLAPGADQVTEATRAAIEFGATLTLADFIEAQFQRERIYDAYADLFERHETRILLTPTVGCEAFPHGRLWPDRIGDVEIELPWIDWAGFLYDANLAGLPACALPMGTGDHQLPVSLQILGPRGADGAVLAFAERLEESLDATPMYPEFPIDHRSATGGEDNHAPENSDAPQSL